jgi:hypothetical protein
MFIDIRMGNTRRKGNIRNNTRKAKPGYYKLQQWDKNFHGFPFNRILDQDNNDIKVAVVSAPLYKGKERKSLKKILDDGYDVVGISSYGFYPLYNKDDAANDSRAAEIKDPKMQEIIKSMKGWLHCSRDPDFLPGMPKLLFSESDVPFINNVKPKNLVKKWDVIYNCGSEEKFHTYHKNWNLAKKCFKKMVDAGYKILIVRRTKMDKKEEEHPNISFIEFAEYYKFVDLIEQAKVLFISGISDASPRVITEALIKNVPVLVNKDIFGGWKYINNHTGSFFTDENDVVSKLTHMIKRVDKGEYHTRKWFEETQFVDGVPKAGIRLKEFITKHVRPEV